MPAINKEIILNVFTLFLIISGAFIIVSVLNIPNIHIDIRLQIGLWLLMTGMTLNTLLRDREIKKLRGFK